jgi:hypothetical protein
MRCFENIFVRRLALGLALAFGLGVAGYAVEEEETLAGKMVDFSEEPKPISEVASCPPTFPIEVFVKLHDADENGDHIVCTDEKGRRFVDNDYVPVELVGKQASGHGNFFDLGVKGGNRDISFSFIAINTGQGSKSFADAAKGEFEYHDQTFEGPDLRVHGDVLCLSASGNTALLIGRVTQSTDFSFPLESLVAWTVEDNGEGINEPVDRVSRPSPIGSPIKSKLPADSCRVKFPELPATRLIVSGNIQVQ